MVITDEKPLIKDKETPTTKNKIKHKSHIKETLLFESEETPQIRGNNAEQNREKALVANLIAQDGEDRTETQT